MNSLKTILVAATLVPAFGLLSGCSTGEKTAQADLSPYKNVAVEPVAGIDKDIARELPPCFEKSVRHGIKSAFKEKGYDVVKNKDAADLIVTPVFRRGSVENPENMFTHAYTSLAYPVRIDTGTVDFRLKDRNGNEVGNMSMGPKRDVRSLSPDFAKCAAQNAFAKLPARAMPAGFIAVETDIVTDKTGAVITEEETDMIILEPEKK